jgi:adenine-specific DNA methylase
MPTRKLIEVALPLEAINAASAREKSIRHGHPSTLHLWWARRPLAACRAVLFASLVDDPSSHPERFPTEEAQQRERERLFGIIERLVKWENSNNEHVLREARDEILKHTNGNPPPVYDPFAGGGSIPLEAQHNAPARFGDALHFMRRSHRVGHMMDSKATPGQIKRRLFIRRLQHIALLKRHSFSNWG